jgi:hypothetical protein
MLIIDRQASTAPVLVQVQLVDAIICSRASRYRTASGSDRMLTLNYSLKVKWISGLNVASGRYRSRFCNKHFFRHAWVTVRASCKLHQSPAAYPGFIRAAMRSCNSFSAPGKERCLLRHLSQSPHQRFDGHSLDENREGHYGESNRNDCISALHFRW